MKFFPLYVFLIFSLISCDKYTFSNNFKVIAHRGYWNNSEGADNSIMSLREAVRLGVDGVELDVCKTKDDSLIVIHGPYHGNYYIPETEYKELIKISLSNGERIPTFREYMREAIKYNIVYLIDMKTIGVESDVLRILTQFNFLHRVKFVSSSSEICEALLRIDSSLYVAYSSGNKSPNELKQIGYSGMHYSIDEWKNHIEWIAEAKSLGLDIAAWVVKTETDIIWCATHEIDNLVTDIPLEVIHFRSNYE